MAALIDLVEGLGREDDVLQVIDVPTGAGGDALSTNFRILSDRAPLSIWSLTTAPTVNDDSAGTATNGEFQKGSRWVNTTTGEIWTNVDPTATAAVWKRHRITNDQVTLSYGATINLDPDREIQDFTLTGNTTLDIVSTAALYDEQPFLVRVRQDGTGGHTLAFSADFRFSTEVNGLMSADAVISSGANKVTRMAFRYDDTDDKLDLVSFLKGY